MILTDLSRAVFQKTQSELKEKDALCKKLREAIKQLEGRLKAMLISQADEKMKESSWETQIRQDK